MKNELLNTFLETIQNAGKAKTSAYDTSATVKRIENDIAWVHIPGGVDETPVKLTVNADVGDTVQVRVSGGTAFLVGNATAPPTDDTKAMEAAQTANIARTSAASAVQAATEAWISAGSAARAANEASYDAGRANEAANSALLQLSNVEDVIGTVNWITEHATYEPTTDTTVQDGKVYYVLSDGIYTIVTDPQDADITSYYEMRIDEALANYVASHLALTDEGLFLLRDDSAYKLLLSATGAQIQDETGAPAVTYGATGTEFSPYKPFYIGNDDAYILFTPATATTEASITIGGTNISLGGDQSLTSLLQQITNVSNAVDDNTDAIDQTAKDVEAIGSFVNVDTSDPAQPVMTLGSAGSAIFLQLMNNMLAFYAKGNEDPVAYIDVDESTNEGVMHITNVIAVKEVRFGRWGWYERPNGNLSVKWIGAQEGGE